MLTPGTVDAESGMAGEIFEALEDELGEELESTLDEEAMNDIRQAWRVMSFAVASGVIEHLVREPPNAPEFAETFSSSAQDEAYWSWLAGFAQVFRGWAAGSGGLPQLRADLNAFFGSGAGATETPSRLRGILR